jgi:hypothetical protein
VELKHGASQRCVAGDEDGQPPIRGRGMTHGGTSM